MTTNQKPLSMLIQSGAKTYKNAQNWDTLNNN